MVKAKAQPGQVQYGSHEHELMLQAGYHITKEDADALVASWKADPRTVPYEEYQRAKAFLAQLSAIPTPTDTDPGWVRSNSRR